MDPVFETCHALIDTGQLGEQGILIAFDQVWDSGGFLQEFRAENVSQIVNTTVEADVDVANSDVVEDRSCEDRQGSDRNRDDLSVVRCFPVRYTLSVDHKRQSTMRLWPGLLAIALLLNLIELAMRKWRGIIESLRGGRSREAPVAA